MINREITYERGINKSYMKIPAIPEENFDEKRMLQKELEGLLPVEKCYVNGVGQYWYNISGKQALDRYCRMNPIGRDFFERLILHLCDEIELLEWNLLEASYLAVDPELIFVNSDGEEISFVFYPQNKGDFFSELQQLIEYLLTKLNHEDKEAVRVAYQIYETMWTNNYDIATMKNLILEGRLQENKESTQEDIGENYQILPSNEEKIPKEEIVMSSESTWNILEKKIRALYEKATTILHSKPSDIIWKSKREEEIPSIIYPTETDEKEAPQITIHPTVCLTASTNEPRGILLYEGQGNYTDLEIGEEGCIVGKNPKVKLRIDRETISQFHAKIEYIDGAYYIEDLNSTNGTFVNDSSLNYKEQKPLTAGDNVRFADVRYRFV